MTLKSCRECKKKVSTEAAACPSCGAPNPTSNKEVVMYTFFGGPAQILKKVYFLKLFLVPPSFGILLLFYLLLRLLTNTRHRRLKKEKITFGPM